ncbi:MAG: hypothetical protein L6300_03090 [Syntrophaceae bacterium]|nr:hypothetical protein [Syntrophaceae bacterium]
MTDEIIKELWKIKDGIANEYGCDVKSLVAYLRAKKHEGDQQVVDLRWMGWMGSGQANCLKLLKNRRKNTLI